MQENGLKMGKTYRQRLDILVYYFRFGQDM
jgi:hypothetical protein